MASAPVMPPKSRKAVAGTGRTKTLSLLKEKIRFLLRDHLRNLNVQET